MSSAPTAERLASQLLSGRRPNDPVAVAERLLAVQAQDLRGARLAIRARTRGLTVTDVDRALTEDRSLLITWLNRGTLHLVRTQDYGWLHALTTPQLVTGNARRLRQEGVSPRDAERGVAVIERGLTNDGPLTRRELRERIAEAGVPTNGQALIHLLLLASLRGIAVRGPMLGKEQAYVLVRDWIGAPAPVERPVALAELARRFLAGHGPADDRDLARWAGMPLRDARAGIAAIAKELQEWPDGLLTVGRRSARPAMPPPCLLGPYDPLLLGWVSREPIVGSHRRIVTDNGLFRPFALVGGRAVAIWRLTDGEVRLAPFKPLKRADAAALEADAAGVVRFLAGAPSAAGSSRSSRSG
ncbi:MAG: hypothetical protein QOE25_1282 [Actinomycetota bacterium]|nr:hypothetical protein [Actinomycetota bacterium]